jgi:multidrug efflux pump subunit AcrB
VQLALRRPVTILVVILGVIIAAWLAMRSTARDIFPGLNTPTIYVAQPYGGMDPAQMEGYLTYYYEYHFLYITGIEHVESKSIQGNALIKLQFYPGTDMAQAMAETVSYVNRARAFMPPGTVPPFVTRFDAGSVPVGNLVFTSSTRTVGEMQDAALNMVRPLFATLPGVSAPPPFGGSARTILINASPERLRAYNVSPDELVTALTTANTITPSGNLAVGDLYPMVPLNSVVRNIKDLESVPVRAGAYPAIYVRDLATVTDGSDLVTSYALVNGRRTVYIPVTKRADASTVTVVNLVKGNLAKFQAAVPDDIQVTYEFDQSGYVTRAIRSLVIEGALGALLTGFMVLLFLRDWRSALIVVINIPVALLGAVLALSLTGQTINLMTLGGLALAIGILVDMSTVVVENIHTHLARGESLGRAIVDSGREVSLPLLIAMMCVLAVFVPAFFMTGVAKALFLPLALAVGFAMIGAYLLSGTLVPILSSWFGRGHESALANDSPGAFVRFMSRYAALASTLVAKRVLVVSVYLIAAVVLAIATGRGLGTEIFPRVDAGQLQLRLRAPAGTQVEGTEKIALRAIDLIKDEAGGADKVELTLGLVGVHAPNYPINLVYQWNGGSHEGVLQVQFKSGAALNMESLKERLRARFARELPSVSFSFEPSDIVSRVMSMGAPTPIEVVVGGANLADDRVFAEKLRGVLAAEPVLRDVQFGQTLDYPTLEVNVDRERAGLMGVRMADVSRSLVTSTSSSRFVVPNYWADANSGIAYQIQVQIPKTLMSSPEELRNIGIPDRSGRNVLLRNVGSVTEGSATGEYARYNGQRTVSVTANLAPGVDLGSAAREVAKAINSAGAPPAKVNVALRGQVVPMQETLGGLRGGLFVAMGAIFLLLVANFQSLRLAVVVIAVLPAVIAGVAATLLLTGTTINIQSYMGAIMAVGVAVANAILLVTFAERARLDGATAAAAAVEAGRSRLRPILMTSFAMMAGMIPMALGLGESGQQTAPLGRAVVGGLAAATIATLLVLPAVYALLAGRGRLQADTMDPERLPPVRIAP